MGILTNHSEHKTKCPTCGEVYDLRFLDKVMEHLHTGLKLDETIKGVKVGEPECAGCHLERLEGTVYKCRTCGKEVDIKFLNSCLGRTRGESRHAA